MGSLIFSLNYILHFRIFFSRYVLRTLRKIFLNFLTFSLKFILPEPLYVNRYCVLACAYYQPPPTGPCWCTWPWGCRSSSTRTTPSASSWPRRSLLGLVSYAPGGVSMICWVIFLEESWRCSESCLNGLVSHISRGVIMVWRVLSVEKSSWYNEPCLRRSLHDSLSLVPRVEVMALSVMSQEES